MSTKTIAPAAGSNWHFKTNNIRIGIDVGWSARTRSCAIAIRGATPPAGTGFLSYEGGEEPVHVGLFTLSNLLGFLGEHATAFFNDDRKTTLIVDGPVGREGPPHNNRHVDSACRSEGLYRRAQPSDVGVATGETYVNATYQILSKFFEAANVHTAPWWGGHADGRRLTFAETHPTVGLAMLLPQQHTETLPSRKRPLRLRGDLIRAKSDWYWRIGAGTIVGEILSCPLIADEVNHERVAGLFCLAVAELLSRNPPNVLALGNGEGIYVVPRMLDAGWHADVERIGVVWGVPNDDKPRDNNDPGRVPPAIPPSESIKAGGLNAETDDPDLFGKADDDLDLVLNDNYAVWQRPNQWLIEFNGPVMITLLDQQHQNPIKLQRAGDDGQGQWRIANENVSPISLAIERGFPDRGHLSNAIPWVIPIRLDEAQ